MRYRFVTAFTVLIFFSCASVDKPSAQATAGAPESAQVEPVKVAFDSSVPKYVLAVLPVVWEFRGSTTDIHVQRNGKPTTAVNILDYSFLTPTRQRQITAQLTSALKGVENFELLASPETRPNSKSSGGEPLVVQAQITECNETIEEESSKFNLFTLFGRNSSVRKGMVGLDLTATESKSGKIVAAFPVQGTFSRVSAETSQGFIFRVGEQQSSAQSTLDQALRIALNDAAKRLFAELSSSSR